MNLVAGTSNRAKLAELQRLVGDAAYIVLPLTGESRIDIDERGETFQANAAAKALAWSQHLHAAGSDSLVIASDGGLLIPALAGWNPLRTHRFAGPAATDLDRASALIEMAAPLVGNDRSICWREAVAIAQRGEIAGNWSAESESGILATTVDRNLLNAQPGFWIPAIWLTPRFGNRPLAALSDIERREIDDHWRRLQEPVRRALVMIGRSAHASPGDTNEERSENRGSSSR